MALGTKRTCGKCNAKFYDLEKDPIICPKCGTVFDVEAANKSKRGRKKPEKDEADDVEIDLGEMEEIEALEELESDDTAIIEELDEDIREEMEGEPDEGIPEEDSDKMLEELDEENDILDSGDEDHSSEK